MPRITPVLTGRDSQTRSCATPPEDDADRTSPVITAIEDVAPDVPRPLDADRLRSRLTFAREIGDQAAVVELERLLAAAPLSPQEVGQ